MEVPREESKALLLAISGPSCSGKTTLSRLLRDALAPHAIIIHEDDFYWPDEQIPLVTTSDGRELQDWDCKEAIDFDALADMLRHVQSKGTVKEEFKSKEDQNDVGEVKVDWDAVREAKDALAKQVAEWVARTGKIIIIVDGFLLYAQGLETVMQFFDVKLLLTVDYEVLKSRREARKGYMTIEGFWEDPKGYVDDIVWPNYVKDHKFLYKEGNIETGVDESACEKLGIWSRPREDMEDMTKCFIWAMSHFMTSIQIKER
jgi:nicotinamide/nicotinate riboside kinase